MTLISPYPLLFSILHGYRWVEQCEDVITRLCIATATSDRSLYVNTMSLNIFKIKLQDFKVKHVKPYHGCSISDGVLPALPFIPLVIIK